MYQVLILRHVNLGSGIIDFNSGWYGFYRDFLSSCEVNYITSILSIVAAEDLHLEQLDVKTVFLHGDLEVNIYMVQPQGYIMSGKERLVCKLKKSLYGLKQTVVFEV